MKHVCMITMHQGDLNIPPSSSFCLVLCETSCKRLQDCACAPQCQWLLEAAVVPEADPHSLLPAPTTERDFLPLECGAAWKEKESETETERKSRVSETGKKEHAEAAPSACSENPRWVFMAFRSTSVLLPQLLIRINLMLHILSIYLPNATICSHATNRSRSTQGKIMAKHEFWICE